MSPSRLSRDRAAAFAKVGSSLVGMLVLVQAGTWAGCCPDTCYEILSASPTVRLPEDESAHCSGGEWWYYTGQVATTDDRSYGIEAVIFHVPGGLVLLPVEAWVGHFAVLDEASGSFAYDQVLWLGPRIAYRREIEGFDLYTPLVQMSGLSGSDRVQASMSDGTYSLVLELTDQKGAVLHGGNGYVPYGLDGWSFYYSRPRMPATGTLEVNGQTREVDGVFWFDRQWGRDLTDPHLAWDWFSLRLDGGTDVMLFVFRDEEQPVVYGTYMPPAGAAVDLSENGIVIEATNWWTSPHTGRTYPVGWDVRDPFPAAVCQRRYGI